MHDPNATETNVEWGHQILLYGRGRVLCPTAYADLKARRVKARAVGVFVAELVHHLALPPVMEARRTRQARGRPWSIL